MREHRAQIILLVRAFEEADREERILDQHVRASAGRRALVVTGLAEANGASTPETGRSRDEAIFRRARLLYEELSRRLPALTRILRIARHGSGVEAAFVVLALSVGLSTNLLGPSRTINLLSVPLLGLLGWNLAVYVALLLRLATRRRLARAAGWAAGLGGRLAGPLLRLSLWCGRRSWSRPTGAGDAATTSKALLRFGALWSKAAAPLLAARARRMLHVSAMMLVVGAVAGMYLRGLAFEYSASWESTLLDARQVQELLGMILRPAATLLDIGVPDVAPLQRPASGPAAVWIHLYAMTAVLFVVVPRMFLLVWEGWRCRRLSDDLPVDLGDAYYRRVMVDWLGGARRVIVLPYSFTPKAGTVDRMKGLLHDFFGARAEVRLGEPLAYGDDAPSPFTMPGGGESHRECVVVLFNLAQSPESEVHGELLEQLRLQAGRCDGQLLVLIEVSVYRQRVQAADRWKGRADAWRRVVREMRLELVEIDLDGPVDNAKLDELRAAIWSPDADEEGGSRRWARRSR